jgi:hypothetical protein
VLQQPACARAAVAYMLAPQQTCLIKVIESYWVGLLLADVNSHRYTAALQQDTVLHAMPGRLGGINAHDSRLSRLPEGIMVLSLAC